MSFLQRLGRTLSATRYFMPSNDEDYRQGFAQHDGPSQAPPAAHAAKITETAEYCAENLPPTASKHLSSIARSFQDRCSIIHRGVPLRRRCLTIALPSFVFLVLAFLIPSLLDNRGYLAVATGTLLFTAVIATSLTLFGPADGYLALDHAKSRLFPPLPALIAFGLTLLPGLQHLRKDTTFKIVAVILQVVCLTGLNYYGIIHDLYMQRKIAHEPELSHSTRKELARRAADLLETEKHFCDDADEKTEKGHISENMTMAVTGNKEISRSFIQTLITLSGVHVRLPRYPWQPKLVLVFITIAIGVINLIAYREEEFTFNDRLGWTIVSALTMLSFTFIATYSLTAITIQFNKLIIGTIINTVLVTIAVLATHGAVLKDIKNVVLLAGGYAIVVLAFSHQISGFFKLVSLKIAGFFVKVDPAAEQEEKHKATVAALRNFSNSNGEEATSQNEPPSPSANVTPTSAGGALGHELTFLNPVQASSTGSEQAGDVERRRPYSATVEEDGEEEGNGLSRKGRNRSK